MKPTLKRRTDETQFDPSTGHFAVITKDDNVDLEFVTRYVEIAGAGTLSVLTEYGVQVDLPSFPAGHRFDIRVKRIRSTSTSATGIVAYF